MTTLVTESERNPMLSYSGFVSGATPGGPATGGGAGVVRGTGMSSAGIAMRGLEGGAGVLATGTGAGGAAAAAARACAATTAAPAMG